MAKTIRPVVNGKAKKLNKIYAVVGGVTKTIKKVYAVVDGITKLVFGSGGELKKIESVTNLSSKKRYLAATTVGNYALFGGGYNTSEKSSTVDVYDSSLTKFTADNLSVARDNLAATTVGDYALFAGGGYYKIIGDNSVTSDVSSTIDVYDSSLTKFTADDLSVGRGDLAATSVGNYALFAGGYGDSTTYLSTVDAYEVT